MISNSLVAVIIPIYKEKINNSELLSLRQCLKVLNKYDIILVGPKGLNIRTYSDICGHEIITKIRFFDPFYFQNIDGYNRLMLSKNFYKEFFDYKFILIYQLDAFVFKDEVRFWCTENYCYIGAPHLPHRNLPNEAQFLKIYSQLLAFINKIIGTNYKISNVGNGGFSLRKTRSCYWLLKILQTRARKWLGNEDGFFKYYGNILSPIFKLPTDQEALKFSIELSPKESLSKLNHSLPFGCHAFQKYDWQTWKPFICLGDHKEDDLVK